MNKILAFLLFILPLLFFPFGLSPFETPKIILGFLGMEIFIIFTLFKLKLSLKSFSKITLLLYLSSFLLTLGHLITSWNIDFFWGNAYRLQGIFLLWHLLVFSMLSSLIKTDLNKKLIFFAFFTSLFTSLFLGTDSSGRIIGTLGEPNFFASFLIFLWPFIFFSSFTNRNQGMIVKLFCLLLLIGFVFLTGSRSGLIALIIESIFIILSVVFSKKLYLALLITLSIVLFSLLLPFREKGGIWENRQQIWQTSFEAGKINPLFGSGFGNIEKPLKLASEKLGKNNWVRYQPIDSAHNIILDFWIQGGAVGIVILVLLTSSSLITFLKTKNLLLITLLFGLLTVLMFNPASIATLIAFWWIIGQGQKLGLTSKDKIA